MLDSLVYQIVWNVSNPWKLIKASRKKHRGYVTLHTRGNTVHVKTLFPPHQWVIYAFLGLETHLPTLAELSTRLRLASPGSRTGQGQQGNQPRRAARAWELQSTKPRMGQLRPFSASGSRVHLLELELVIILSTQASLTLNLVCSQSSCCLLRVHWWRLKKKKSSLASVLFPCFASVSSVSAPIPAVRWQVALRTLKCGKWSGFSFLLILFRERNSHWQIRQVSLNLSLRIF